MRLRLALTLAVVPLFGAVAGCSSPSTQTSNSGFHVATPNGEVSVSLSGQLPPNWPAEFPLPNGAKPVGSGSLGNGSTHMVAVYEVKTSGRETISFYQSNSQLKTSNEKSVGIGSFYVGTLQINEPYNGSITVASHEGTTYLVVVIEGVTGTPTTQE